MIGRSWLVQRLTKPIRAASGFTDNPFSFGGGLLNGGLSKEAMSLLRDVFSFDYMGAAEFEFGAVPAALQKIAEADLTAFTFGIDGRTIYALAPTGWRSDVEARIRAFAKEGYGPDHYPLKERTELYGVLHGAPYSDRLDGWLELDNGFLFFVDEEMWSRTCELFGVERARVVDDDAEDTGVPIRPISASPDQPRPAPAERPLRGQL